MIDLAIIGLYLISLLVIGLVYSKKMSQLRDFSQSVGHLKHNKLILVATLFASAVGGGTTFGLTEKVFSHNLALVYGLLLTVPIDILIGIYIVPLIAKYAGVTSIGEIMHIYYGRSGRIITGIAALITALGYLAAQISVSGKIFQYILGISPIEGIIISYLIVIIYTTVGGLRSVIVTNLLQFFAMLIAIPVISAVGIYTIGFENFAHNIPVAKYSLIQNSNLLIDTISATLGFTVMGIPPTYIQRILLNKNSAITTSAVIYKSVIYVIFICLIAINGLIAAQLVPGAGHSLVVPHLIDVIIPTGLKGIVIAGLLASVMSTADSDLNVASTSIVNDILTMLWPSMQQSLMIKLAQFATITVGSGAIILSLFFDNVVDLVIFVASFWVPIIMVPMLFATIGKLISERQIVFSIISTTIIICIWHRYFSDHLLKAVLVGTLFHITVFYSYRLRNSLNSSS